jgi:hypothetical protein
MHLTHTSHPWNETSAAGFDREAYEADGVVVMRRVFTPADVETLREGWRNLKSSMEQHGLQRQARFVFGVLPEPIVSVWQHPTLLRIVKTLIGNDLALYMNRLLVKDEHWTGPIVIHQDMPYFNGGLQKVSVFVPLEPTQADGGNGGLKFVLGSHRYGNLERGAINREQWDPMPELAPSLDVGDIVVMNFLTWHYSEHPVVPSDRPLLQLAYQPSDDGSFAGQPFGVAAPTLVSGTWKTRHFAELRKGITPDAR